LFINIRRAASWGHPRHVSDVPRGARIERATVVIVSEQEWAGWKLKVRN
jgi:hypothetical protein